MRGALCILHNLCILCITSPVSIIIIYLLLKERKKERKKHDKKREK